MNYKHIIFDFGNVLATFQSDDLLRSYCNREDLPILKNDHLPQLAGIG